MSRRLTVMCASAASVGHFHPMLALAREIAARGSTTVVATPERWRDLVEDLGIGFVATADPAPASDDRGGDTERRRIAAAARAVEPAIRDVRPDVVVSDLFTLAPALAAERAGTSIATLIPDPYHVAQPGNPVFAQGLLPARTPVGRALWRAPWPLVRRAHRRHRAALNRLRAELGLAPVERADGAISSELTMVATFPQLEYPRRWPAGVHVTGPMLLEPAGAEPASPAPGARPLVLVVSTSTRLGSPSEFVGTTLDALASEPVEVVATLSRPGMGWDGPTPANATVVDWLSLAESVPKASLVICHGGHGTVATSLCHGVPVLVCPAGGNMGMNGARLTWAGAGLMVPDRLLGAGPLRWAARRLLADRRFASRAAAIAAWARDHPGPARGAALVERYALR
jgi:UDP:flavonoid glycosyltransferase YjiC (YdhE family)